MGFDPIYLIFAAPAMLLSMFASMRVKSAFAKYSKVRAFSGLTGAQAALQMLRSNGVTDVQVRKISGMLTDNYNPTNKVLSLSPEVHDGTSLSSVGVACHEAGHALQHASGYTWLRLRSAMVPITSISSKLSMWVILIGCTLQMMGLVLIGVALFAVGFAFSVVTLPVEWDASARAKAHIVSSGIVSPDQGADAGSVLNAAFLTYIAAATSSLLTLLYYLLRSGALNGRGRN